MKKAASIFFRATIKPTDIDLLIYWMRNPNITKYLNEDPNIIYELKQLLWNVPSDMLTYNFNRRGRFFMVCLENKETIGFIKLHEIK